MAGAVHGRVVCMAGGCVAGEMATAVDSTHPTGMHSYFIMLCVRIYFFKVQSEFSAQSTAKKNFSQIAILQLCADQSEVSALPAGYCIRCPLFYHFTLKMLRFHCFSKKIIFRSQAVCLTEERYVWYSILSAELTNLIHM